MSVQSLVILYGLATGAVIAGCAWMIGYLIMLGLIYEVWQQGKIPGDRALLWIIALVASWPFVAGVTLSRMEIGKKEAGP